MPLVADNKKYLYSIQLKFNEYRPWWKMLSKIKNNFQKVRKSNTFIDVSTFNSIYRRTYIYHIVKQKNSDIYNKFGISPLMPFWISSSEIERHSPTIFDRWLNMGEVKNGMWDCVNVHASGYTWQGELIEDHLLYQAMEKRYLNGRDWKDTEFVKKQYKKLSNGNMAWYGKCSTKDEIKNRCKYIDTLHQELGQEGYKTQNEMGKSHIFSFDPFHEITVNINRDGELLFDGDGRHRLFLSKLLGLEDIAVRCNVVHSQSIKTLEQMCHSNMYNNE